MGHISLMVIFERDGSKRSLKKLKQPMMEYGRNADRRQFKAMALWGSAKESQYISCVAGGLTMVAFVFLLTSYGKAFLQVKRFGVLSNFQLVCSLE
jgi:hypothetical protein